MHDGLRVLALVPARGGSKGLPGKNLRPLSGLPLVAWSVAAALAAPSIDAVVVSTDSEEIAAAALAAGAEVPFMRPRHLAEDHSRMVDVVLDALDTLAAAGRPFDLVVLLQPTSPLRSAGDIESALRRRRETGGRAVASVCPVEHSPLLAGELPADGSLARFLRPQDATANRQELPDFHRLNGAVYVADAEFLREHRSFIADGTYAYVMPAERSVDIDTELDFTLAECLLARAAGS